MVTTLQARIFAALVASYCVLGLCLAFAQPVFSLPDEPMHWLTANVRLEHLFGRDGCVPTVFEERCPRECSRCSSIPRLQLACHTDPGLYGGVLTYPGVLLSKLVVPRQTESAIRQVQGLMLARLLQGLLMVLCLVRVGVLARRTRRVGSLTLAAFMLSPLLAQQSFAVSSDTAQLSFALFLCACVMYWDALSRLDALAFLLLGYAATSKPTVLTLMLPAVLAGYWFSQFKVRASALGQEQQGGWLRELVGGLGRLLKIGRDPSPQTIIAWSALGLSVLTVALSLLYDSDTNATVAPEDQSGRISHLQELRDRPGLIFELVGNLRLKPSLAKYWVGPLGWLDTRVSNAVVHGFRNLFWLMCGLELAALIALAVRARRELAGAAGRCLRALPALSIGLLAVVLNVLLVTAIMYVLWTPADVGRVHGVQIRYFFPAAMVLIALVFRTLQSTLLSPGGSDLEFPPRTRWLTIAAPCVVLALSLPLVARLYVDLGLRYHYAAHCGGGL